MSVLFAAAVLLHGTIAEAIYRDLIGRDLNAAVLVAIEDRVVLDAGYGWADRAKRIPFTTSTIAQIGSLTKQFTAAAVVELAHENKLALSDPIKKYLTGAPPEAARITVEQLLTHTSGLAADCGDDFDRVSKRDLVSRCLRMVRNPPGAAFLYSNLGYSVLAAIIENVTGRSYENVIRSRFLEPLHMRQTRPIFDRVAHLHGDYWDLKGNGGMEASARDMDTWFHALTASSPLPAVVGHELMTPHARRDEDVEYGYGWFIRRNAAGEIEQVSHTGSDGMSFAAIVWRPRQRAFYYFVTTSGEKNGADAASAILKFLKINPIR